MSTTVSRAYKADHPRIDADGNFQSTSLYYIVFGADNEDEAVSAARASADSFYRDMPLQELEVAEKLGDTTFEVRADYESDPNSLNEKGEKPESSFSFEISAATKHITKSINTVWKSSGSPDNGKTIGYDGERIAGTDIIMPQSKFSETHFFDDDQITTRYKKRVEQIVGTMNNASFRDYEPGELLFMGAQGSRSGTGKDDLWSVTFQFAFSPNRKNIEVSDNITIPQKYGWDYFWVRYMPFLDTASKSIVQKPVAAYVERVYYITDFRQLEIGR